MWCRGFWLRFYLYSFMCMYTYLFFCHYLCPYVLLLYKHFTSIVSSKNGSQVMPDMRTNMFVTYYLLFNLKTTLNLGKKYLNKDKKYQRHIHESCRVVFILSLSWSYLESALKTSSRPSRDFYANLIQYEIDCPSLVGSDCFRLIWMSNVCNTLWFSSHINENYTGILIHIYTKVCRLFYCMHTITTCT